MNKPLRFRLLVPQILVFGLITLMVLAGFSGPEASAPAAESLFVSGDTTKKNEADSAKKEVGAATKSAKKEAGAIEKTVKGAEKKVGSIEKSLQGFILNIANNRKVRKSANKKATEKLSLHQIEQGNYGKSGQSNESYWNTHHGIDTNYNFSKKDTLNPAIQVFGYHPYWMGSTYKAYPFHLLSVVSYFSYELDPSTGNYTSIHNWKTTGLVDSAKKAGTKVLLAVSNFGSNNNKTFLSNINAQKTLIKNLIELIDLRGADGVNIDFENVSGSNSSDFTEFIIDLSNQLKGVNQDYMVTLALPAFDNNKVYDIATLDKYVDLYVLMGYDFYGKWSAQAGPQAPLTKGDEWWNDLETAVDGYLLEKITPSKLLLGLPYYGAAWKTKNLSIPSKANSFINVIPYRNIDTAYLKVAQFDSVGATSYYAFRSGTKTYEQYWFDDATSLGVKYDWVLKKKIGGIGIWALGYDNGTNDLWNVIHEKFTIDSLPKDTLPHPSGTADSNKVDTAASDTLSYLEAKLQAIIPIFERNATATKAMGFGVLLLLCFVYVGLLLVLTDKKLRAGLIRYENLLVVYLAILLILPLIFMREMEVLTSGQSTFFIVIVILLAGGKLVMDYIYSRKELP